MTDKKLTDSEIIKALECCTKGLECKNCPANPHKGNYGYCTGLLLKDALDLINRQKEEIERLNFVRTRDAQRYEEKISNQAHTNCVLIDLHSATIKEVKELEDKIKTAKSEAYKEVWGKLRGMCDAPNWCVCLSEIDNYFEELVGEDK